MLNSFYIISEISNQIYKVLKKNSGINVIYRPSKQDKDNNNLIKIIKTNIHNKVYIANKNNICPIQGLAGVYLSAFNKKNLTSIYFNKNLIGSAHSFKELREKIKARCNIIFLSPVLPTREKKNIGLIKFLLISKQFPFIKLYPLGGIQNVTKIKNCGIKGFAGIRYFENKL